MLLCDFDKSQGTYLHAPAPTPTPPSANVSQRETLLGGHYETAGNTSLNKELYIGCHAHFFIHEAFCGTALEHKYMENNDDDDNPEVRHQIYFCSDSAADKAVGSRFFFSRQTESTEEAEKTEYEQSADVCSKDKLIFCL